MSITISNDYQRRTLGQLVDGEAGSDALALALPSERVVAAGRTFTRVDGEGLFVPQQRELYSADAVREIAGASGDDYKVVERHGVLAVRPMNGIDYALQIGSGLAQAAVEMVQQAPAMIRNVPATVRRGIHALSEVRLTPATAGYTTAALLAAFAPAASGQQQGTPDADAPDSGELIIDVPVALGSVPRVVGEQLNLLRLGAELFAGGSGAGIEATVIPRATLSYRNNQGAFLYANGWEVRALLGVPFSRNHVLHPDERVSALSDSFEDPFQAGNKDEIYHETRGQLILNNYGELSVEGTLIYNIAGDFDATIGLMAGIVAADGSSQPWERYRLQSIINKITTEDIGDDVHAGDARHAPTIRPAYGLRSGIDFEGYRLGLELRFQHDGLKLKDTFGIFGAYFGGTWDIEL